MREQAARLKAIFENSANMMIWTLDRDFRITSFNDHFHDDPPSARHGILIDVGDHFIELWPRAWRAGSGSGLLAKYQTASRGKPQQFEVELRDLDGRPCGWRTSSTRSWCEGEVHEISCLAHGITDRKEAQNKLLESLHEKEVLLKEVHHRVKNNLQVISSILNLQSGYVGEDPRMLELLRDSRDRIRSMSFIHESLYQTKNFNSVDLGAYIEGLCTQSDDELQPGGQGGPGDASGNGGTGPRPGHSLRSDAQRADQQRA